MRLLRLAVVFVLPACGAGHDATPDATHALALSDVASTIVVSSYEHMVFITATFTSPAGRTLPLEASASATFRASAIDLTRYDGLDHSTGESFTEYSTTIDTTDQPVVDAEPVDVLVALGGVVATSMATIPPGFHIDSVTGSLTSSPIVVSWSPTASDAFAWTAQAAGVANHACVVSAPTGPIPDTGTLTIDSTMIHLYSMGFPCGAVLSLVRSRAGTIARELAGGTVQAIQSRVFL